MYIYVYIYIPLIVSILVYLLKTCFFLTIHCMIFGSCIGKYLLKPKIGTRYLMELVSRNGT